MDSDKDRTEAMERSKSKDEKKEKEYKAPAFERYPALESVSTTIYYYTWG